MEYFECGDLLRNMESDKNAIPKSSVIFISAEVLEGLDFLHSNNIVYRDLKHENILVKSGKSVEFLYKNRDLLGTGVIYRMRISSNLN